MWRYDAQQRISTFSVPEGWKALLLLLAVPLPLAYGFVFPDGWATADVRQVVRLLLLLLVMVVVVVVVVFVFCLLGAVPTTRADDDRGIFAAVMLPSLNCCDGAAGCVAS